LAVQAIMIWAPYTTTNGQWIANKVLQGFFMAPIESLCEVSLSDVVSGLIRQTLAPPC
jgi:hypothetical protein